MNVPNQVINIDVNNRLSQNVYLICNNKDSGTRSVDVNLFANSEILDVSGCTVTAAIVTDGFLIDEERECQVNKNVITVPIDNTDASYSGIMLVELKITGDGNKVLSTPIAFKVRVTRSITENAKVNEKSIGTVADVIKEVAAAKGKFKSLAEALASKADKATTTAGYGITDAITNTNDSVKTQNIASGAVASRHIANGAVKWYHIEDTAINVNKLGDKAVTMAKLADDVVAELNKVNGKQTTQYITDTITTVDELIALNDVNTVYNGVMSGFSSKFGQTSDSVYLGFRIWFELTSPKEAKSYARIISLSDGTIWTTYGSGANIRFNQISYSKKQIDKLISDITIEGGGVAVPGADGKSAYEVAVENGFSGNEADWLASLKGANGKDGAKGDKGDKGDTGADGQDYVLTAADKQEIANLATDTIPAYVRTAAEAVANKVLSVTGEADSGAGNSSGYTNQLLNATDESGSPYNGGKGYKSGHRLNSSGVEKDDYPTGVCCTGFISCKAGDVIRFKNITVASSTVTAYIAKYDSSKTFISISSAVNEITENSYTVSGASTAYVRFSFGVISDDSIITVNEEIGEIATGETAKAVVPFNLAFITDLHYDDTQVGRYTAAKKAMDVINETAPIDVEIMGGDYCNNYTATTGGTAAEARFDISNCKKVFSDSRRRLWLRGNHDSNGYPNERLPKAEIYNRIFRSQHTMVGFVENADDPYGCYGYMDFDNAKIRLIVVNTSDNDDFGTATPEQSTHTAPMINSHNVGAKQLQWIADEALNFSDKENVNEWGIIFISHVPLYNSNSWYNSHTYVDDNGKSWDCNLINLVSLVTAYRNKIAFTAANNGETVNKDFSAITETADIIGFFSGHTHALTNISYNGFNFISCPNANGGANVSSDGATYSKSNVGSVGETALSVISVDRTNKKIHAFCYGAGCDREFTY